MAKVLMKGCEALAEAAIRAGCRHFFGYPITPQTEVPEYLARRMPEVGGVFLQAESEVAAANMLYGAAGAGVRVFTSSSSPGVSLMAEGLSYIAGAELPVVIINIVRGGPGLGGILPAQSDYFLSTKGGGHGDFHAVVFAPSTVQEAADLMILAFDLADKYRGPVIVMGDGIIGQMMEPVEFSDGPPPEPPPKPWATTGAKGRKPNVINSLYLDPVQLEAVSLRLKAKYEDMARTELRYELFSMDQPYDVLLIAYGTIARVCKTSIGMLSEQGVNVGLFRPITLYPFPYEQVKQAAAAAKCVLVAEMSMGQMLEDVKLAGLGDTPVHFLGHAGGIVHSPGEIAAKINELRQSCGMGR